MIRKLKRNLYWIYMSSAGLILAIVIAAVLILSARQLAMSTETAFQSQVYHVYSKLQNDSEVKFSWISELEINRKLIICIEDNGMPISYPGSWKTKTNRDILSDRLKETVLMEEGKDLGVLPISSSEYQTKIYKISGDNGDRYYGQGAVIKVKGGYRSLTMLISRENELEQVQKQFALYLLVYAGGMAALSFASRLLVEKSAAPVEASRKSQTEFIAAASHELRSPLAVIRASMEIMKKEQAYIPRFADSVDRECKRMARLTDDMLLLASADAASFHVKLEPVDTDSMLVDIYEEFSQICRQNNMKFHIMLSDEELPKIEGDEERIRQILNILLNNAISYSGNAREGIPAEVAMRAFLEKDMVVLEFIDHGKGISEEDKEKIFGRFYRTDPSRNDKMHFGLGLSIARELMNLHNGTIAVKDTKGGGATFVLKFRSVNA